MRIVSCDQKGCNNSVGLINECKEKYKLIGWIVEGYGVICPECRFKVLQKAVLRLQKKIGVLEKQ